MTSKRIGLGLLATVAFTVLVEALISLAQLAVHPVARVLLLGFIGTALGAYIARRRFVLPALGLWLLSSVVVFYIVYSIAEPVGQASISGILQFNALGIMFSFAAVMAGAIFGQYLASRHQQPCSTG